MLNAVRRGPASIARSLRLPLLASKSTNFIASWKFFHLTNHITLTPIPRTFSTVQLYRQAATQQSAYAERDIEVEDTSSTPSQADQVQYGPVTQFKELEERKMVCKTIVRTITEDMGLHTMTHVQSLTINETLKGVDVYVHIRV